MKTKSLSYKIIVLLLLAIAVFATGLSCTGGSGQNIDLTFWDPSGNEAAWQSVIQNFQSSHKGVRIAYVAKSPLTYEEELVDAMAAGNGPDIFSIGNDWLSRYGDKISPLTVDDNLPIRKLQSDYIPVLLNDFLIGDKIYGLSPSLEVLVMYYNRQLLNSAGIARPPTTWPELVSNITNLTRIGFDGRINQSAVALGTSNNISEAAKILQALMLQSDVKFYDASFSSPALSSGNIDENGDSPAARALRFYTQFADPSSKVFTWSEKLENDIDTFSQGNTAIIFGFGNLRQTLNAKNAFLDYGITALPQLSPTSAKVNLAQYFAQTVWSGSGQSSWSWEFIKFASNAEQSKNFSGAVSQVSTHLDVISQQQKDPNLGVFADNALTSKTIAKPQAQKFEDILKELINDTALVGLEPREAISRAEPKIRNLIQQYPMGIHGTQP